MIEGRRLVSCLLRSVAIVAGAAILAPSCAFADSAPPTQIELTPGPLPTLLENGVPGVFVLTVKNTFDSPIMIRKIQLPVALGPFVEIGHVDPTDRLVAIPLTSTTCFKASGAAIVLNPGKTCTFTFAPTPPPFERETPVDSGATTASFTVTANRGPAVTLSPTFIIEDIPAAPEPTTLALLFTGLLGFGALLLIRSGKQKIS